MLGLGKFNRGGPVRAAFARCKAAMSGNVQRSSVRTPATPSTPGGAYSTSEIIYDHDDDEQNFEGGGLDAGVQNWANDDPSLDPSLDPSSIEMDHQSWGEPGFNMADVSLMEFSEEESQLERDLRDLSSAYDESQYEVQDLEKRIRNRTKLLELMRTAYLKDIVTLKHVLNDVLSSDERRNVIEEYNQRLPSIDLRQPLRVFAPKNAEMRLKPCKECGGHVDITMHDSDAATRMKAALDKYRGREDKLRLQIATADAKLDAEAEAHRATKKTHEEEKRFLYAEMKKANNNKDKVATDNFNLSEKVKSQREGMHNLNEQIKQLVVKEKRLVQTEQEMGDLKQQIGQLTMELTATRQECAGFKAKLHAVETKIVPELNARIAAQSSEIEAVRHDLSESLVTTNKFRDKCAFMEKTEKEKDARLAALEAEVVRIEVEKQQDKDSTSQELLLLTDETARLRDEMRFTKAELRDTVAKLAATSAMLAGANELVLKKDEIIAQRDNELMDSAAEMEALEEELG